MSKTDDERLAEMAGQLEKTQGPMPARPRPKRGRRPSPLRNPPIRASPPHASRIISGSSPAAILAQTTEKERRQYLDSLRREGETDLQCLMRTINEFLDAHYPDALEAWIRMEVPGCPRPTQLFIPRRSACPRPSQP